MTNPESVNDVLAEMRADARNKAGQLMHDAATGGQLESWADRLAAAHAREVGELRERIKELEQEVEQLGYDLQEEYPDD